MGELVIVVCLVSEGRCSGLGPASPEREAAVRARFAEARALLEPAGLWATEPVVALDAGLGGVLATTYEDAAREGLAAYPGRPVIFFDAGIGAVPDLDIVLHELTHVWLRAAGAKDARWRLEVRQGADGRASGRANHESALVHEGLADFVAAALTRDPIIGEGHGGSGSLRVEVTCPDGLTGSPHPDSVVVSGSLWALGGAGRDPAAMSDALAAARTSAADASRGVSAMVEAVGAALSGQSNALSTRWAELVERRGLARCGEPIVVGAKRVSARSGEFIAAGTARFTEGEPVEVVGGPLSFTARAGGSADRALTAKIVFRSSQANALAVNWRALSVRREVLGEGRAQVEGWPSQWASVTAPLGSHSLSFVFTTATPGDVAYNDVQVSWEVGTPSVVTPETVPRSGCLVGVSSFDLVIAVGVAWMAGRKVVRRFRRAEP